MTQPEMITPKEFSALLEKRGVKRTARWVRRMARKGRIRSAAMTSETAHILIPVSEADRLLTPVSAS
jgi:hypothetical protein